MVNLNSTEYYRLGGGYSRPSWEPTERSAGDNAPNDNGRPGSGPARSTLPSTVAGALRDQCHINWRSFFLAITLDNGDQVYFTGPDTISREDCRQMFDMDRFSQYQGQPSRPDLSRRESMYPENEVYYQENGLDHQLYRREPATPPMYPSHGEARTTRARRRQRASGSRRAVVDSEPVPVPSVRRGIKIADTQAVWAYYIDGFTTLQQLACKIIGKVFVKAIAPKKQSHHPYTGGEERAPTWWPKPWGTQANEMVRHREPDHLYKRERIHLCAHILRLVTDPVELQHEGIKAVEMTVAKLESITMDAMSHWFSDTQTPRNAAKKGLLKEMFRVAKHEEKWKKGYIDPTTLVFVSTSRNAYDPDEDDDDEVNIQISTQEESDMSSGTSLTRMSPVRTPTSTFASEITARSTPHYGEGMELDSSHNHAHPHHHGQHHPYTLPAVGPLPNINTMQLDDMIATSPSDAAVRRSSLYTSPPAAEYPSAAAPPQQVYSPVATWQSAPAAPTAATLASTDPGLYAYQPSYMSSYGAAQVSGGGGYSAAFRDASGYPALPALPALPAPRFSPPAGPPMKVEGGI
ncbi:hypothetical protein QBC44DRAFT_358597 [Cladorrhinum sp. PSN332]|nr:hypothetical protein QBC44DRAFT_358597 [Cladorrhinum sp. PSN332]